MSIYIRTGHMKQLFLFLTLISFALCMGSCEKDEPEPEPEQARVRGKIAKDNTIIYSGGFTGTIDKNMSGYDFISNTMTLYTTEGYHFVIKILDLEPQNSTSTPQRLNYTCSGAFWGDFRTTRHLPSIYLDKMDDVLVFTSINLYSESGGSFSLSSISFYR